MKILTRFSTFLAILTLVFTTTPVSATVKDVQNFYFDSFDADYYITKDSEGVSHMHVVETLTAVFPDYDQNKGIERYIPDANQANKNTVFTREDAHNVKVTRNGEPEPIYDIDKEEGYYIISTGTEEYIHGVQVFTFEYDFAKVITDFSSYQELYWDTNGTDWLQRFDNLTTRVHFEDSAKILTGDTSCYVGSYGVSGQNRCVTTEIDDGFEFSTSELARGENLTFAIKIKPNTFTVPIEYNYSAVACFIIVSIIFVIVLICSVISFKKKSTKRLFYKNIFVAPQYQPQKDISIAESARLAIMPTKNAPTATLMDLAVKQHISLVRGEKKLVGPYKWSIHVNNVDGLTEEEKTVLKILHDGVVPEPGEEFEIKANRSAHFSYLIAMYFDEASRRLTQKGYLEEQKNTLAKSVKTTLISYFVIMGICWIIPFFIAIVDFDRGYIVAEWLTPLTVLLVAAAIIVPIVLSSINSKYLAYTEEGLKANRYLEGLKLYMSMAEADRIAFLQSVEGADTSPQGVVKLYEKLLPYAVLFGIESSWLKELSRYYEMETTSSSWYSGADRMDAVVFSSLVSTSRSSIVASTTSYQHSTTGGSHDWGGSSSSSSSGSGGGGSSGGGGGGGGGGGR